MPQTPYAAPVGFSYAHISSATTTEVKATSGVLGRVIINSASAGTITLYDNTAASGTVIGVITISTPITVPTAVIYSDFGYAVTFKTALTIVTSATCDLTVMFR